MKKTVSINIGGIIFHIEEDGYEKLKNYLESVNKYFSTFEDSSEIISDIESRIAEIFLAKLAEGRQTVNIEDVSELIATMGTTSDFEATIETGPSLSEEPPKQESTSEPEAEPETEYSSNSRNQKLYRDSKRKIIGGVASGIAHYFQVDPLWIRLLFLASLVNAFVGELSGMVFLAYVILWIVLPETASLEDDKKVKKLFRNSDQRVLGGVASGIASYFGTDISVIRLLFVLSIFLGGAGVLIYLILWIITPEAKSITEKMQMQGEPVTLSNIEENVKRSLKVEDGEETPLVKILLFPFRLIALIINGLGKALGPLLKILVELIRIAFGSILVLMGFSLMVIFTVSLLAILGIGTWTHVSVGHWHDLPVDLIRQSVEEVPVLAVYLVTFIPALAITLLGLYAILKRNIVKSYVAWSLLGLWILGMVITSISIPQVVNEFSSENDYRSDRTFEITPATPTLSLNELGADRHDRVKLRIRGHEDSVYQLVQRISSRGSDRTDAEQNARNVEYKVTIEGEDILFDSDITLPESVPFRFQEADLTFYVPFGKTFRMDRSLSDILENTLYPRGYRSYQMEDNDWKMERGGIVCITCPSTSLERDEEDRDLRKNRSSYKGKEEIDYPFEGFEEIKIAAYFNVEIKKGDDFQVVVRGSNEDLDQVYLNQVGTVLEANFNKDNWKWWQDDNKERINLFITMPELQFLKLSGACDGEVYGFDNDRLNLELYDASDVYVKVFTDRLKLKVSGASKVKLRGESDQLEVQLNDAAQLKGFDFKAEDVEMQASDASRGEVYGTGRLELSAGDVSRIRYRGSQDVEVKTKDMARVNRD